MLIQRGDKFFRQETVEKEITEIEALREMVEELKQRVQDLENRPPTIQYIYSYPWQVEPYYEPEFTCNTISPSDICSTSCGNIPISREHISYNTLDCKAVIREAFDDFQDELTKRDYRAQRRRNV